MLYGYAISGLIYFYVYASLTDKLKARIISKDPVVREAPVDYDVGIVDGEVVAYRDTKIIENV